MQLTPDRSSKGMPSLPPFVLIGLIVGVSVAVFLPFLDWGGSPHRQIVGCLCILAMLVFSIIPNKLVASFLGLLFFSQISISLTSFLLDLPAMLQIYFSDIFWLLLLLSALGKRQRMRPDALGKMFLLLTAWQCVSAFQSVHIHRSLLFVYMQFKYLVVYLVVLNLDLTDRIAKQIYKVIVLIVGIQGLLGIAQLIYGEPLGLSIIGEPEKASFFLEGFRVAGTLGGTNSLGGFLAGLLVFLIPYLFAQGGFFLLGCFAAGITALVVSLCRAGWLSFFVGAFLGILTSLRARIINSSRVLWVGVMGLALGIILASLVLLYYDKIEQRFSNREAQSSAAYRYEQFPQAWPMIKRYPVFGIGPGVTEYFGAWNDYRIYVENKLRVEILGNQPHNSLLQYWVEGGYPSALLWAAIVVMVIARAVKRPRQGAQESDGVFLLRHAAALGALALMLQALFGTAINSQQIQMTFWILLALARNRTVRSIEKKQVIC
jgi:hypothetical protein